MGFYFTPLLRMPRSPLALALFAYAWWGFVPAYWKQIPSIPSSELILWRILLSVASLLPVLAWRKEFPSLRATFASKSSFFGLAATSILIGFNWSLYIWAIAHGHIVESSLGYFLNPLINMALGSLLLKERLSRPQLFAAGLAGAGVAWLTWIGGRLPWIALLLALSFSLYGLGRKLLRLPTLAATSMETFLLALPAGACVLYLASQGSLHASVSPKEWAWLSLAGFITTVPLLAFAEAAVQLPLTVMGFVQFLSPSFQFLLGVLVYQEPFYFSQAVGFALIWAGLACFLISLQSSART